MTGNDHVRFGPGVAGKGPALRAPRRRPTGIPGGDGRPLGVFEDTMRLAAALRPALAARGVPSTIYVDNGSAFVDAALKRACAKLGIKLIHSGPGRPPLTGQPQPGTRPRHAGDVRILAPGWEGCRNVRRHELMT